MGKSGDLDALQTFLGRCAGESLRRFKNPKLEAQERADAQQELQVYVPAQRRLRALKQASLDVVTPRARLSLFLLGMVAQSQLFPNPTSIVQGESMLTSSMPGPNSKTQGLTPVHRRAALNVLRENSELFGDCPAWVAPLVCNPGFLTAKQMGAQEIYSQQARQRIQLRDKILDSGILTPDEEMLLTRVM